MWGGLNLQNIVNFISYELDCFHDLVLGVIVFILFIVGYWLIFLTINDFMWSFYFEDSFLEFFWTCFPIVILFFIGVPSMVLLYSYESERSPDLSIKVRGHQWYWSYDYSNFINVSFDSYIKPLFDLSFGEFRLLEVDSRVVIPLNVLVRFIVSSSDVLHSWRLPAFGLKIDANPGRLNMIQGYSNQVGLFYGQCSEICGANHSFIPICLEVVSFSLFKFWLGRF